VAVLRAGPHPDSLFGSLDQHGACDPESIKSGCGKIGTVKYLHVRSSIAQGSYDSKDYIWLKKTEQ
jgi:hypothetical protein